MPRRYRRTNRVRIYRPLKTVKYSNETVSSSITFNTGNYPIEGKNGSALLPIIIHPTDVAGMRKVKNISVRIASSVPPNVVAGGSCVMALIYAPQGTSDDSVWLSSGQGAPISLYEPNQNVIASGIVNYITHSTVFMGNRLARNLNSGDAILLVIKPLNPIPENASVTYAVSVNYAICYS